MLSNSTRPITEKQKPGYKPSTADPSGISLLIYILKMATDWHQADLQLDSLARTELPSAVSTFVIAAVLVALRFASRRLSKAGLWWDDWIQLPAIVSSFVFW